MTDGQSRPLSPRAPATEVGPGFTSSQPPGRRRETAALAGVLMCGVALRLLWAWRLDSAAEWEADGCLWAWAGSATRNLASGCRPAGLQRLWATLGSLTPANSLLALRIGAVVLSMLVLGCAWRLTRELLSGRGADERATSKARLGLCLLWAASPALVCSGPRFVAEALAGGSVCLMAAAFVRWRRTPGGLTWLWLCAATALSLSVGGVVVALALAAGLLVFVLGVPRISLVVSVFAACGLAAVAAFGVARWQDDSRPWRPDSGPGYALASLVGAPVLFDDRESALPELRSDEVWRSSWATMRGLQVSDVGLALGDRMQALIAPERFAAVAAETGVPDVSGVTGAPGDGARALGLLDALLTGAALALALRALGRRAAPGAAALPRVAAFTGLGVWALASGAGATGPFALAGVQLVLLALAVVELATWNLPAGSSQAVVSVLPKSGRRVGSLACALLCALALALLAFRPARDDAPPSSWLEQLTQVRGQGVRLVALLAMPEPLSVDEDMQLARILVDPAAPFLRRPLLAREHAIAVVAARPNDDAALMLMAWVLVDCLDIRDAEELAATLVDETGRPTSQGRLVQGWMRGKVHRARLDGLR